MGLFFKVKTVEEVLQLIHGCETVTEERILLKNALGCVLSRDIMSPEDLPGFERSSVDGYAIKARDSFGASEGLPALLEVVGEIGMGGVPRFPVKQGQAAKIATGGMLPEGADSVVMVEYCNILDEKTIEISKATSPRENVILPDDDFKKGSLVLSKGRRLRPQDVGILAALGVDELWAYQKPKVAIISTGDEVVPISERPRLGQIRDVNTYTLSAFCLQEGAVPELIGLCGDDLERLIEMVRNGLRRADTVWISGGSSVGTRDLTLKTLESFDRMEILVHGISISPGKPTIIARRGHQIIFGLPGHTASAMVVAEIFLAPFLSRLSGEEAPGVEGCQVIRARLIRNIESASGRDDFIRVKLAKEDKGWTAEPLFGKSGLISTLVDADGLLRVGRNTEGLYQDQMVEVAVFRSSKGAAR